ncbi:hypothetical protein ACFRAM_02810 [Paenibacillus sp. NPDC056722]|uniref:hypothetical protein n=1 Tax=Paenibacillus sp. NPDC056722 TaxID=3345924 RepID=UPI003673E118
MKPKINKEVKDYIKSLVKQHNIEIQEFDKHRELMIPTDEILNTIFYISSVSEKTHKTIYDNFSDDLILSYTGIASLSYLSIAVFQENCKNPIDQNWFLEKSSDPNFVLQSQLVNITNHALSVVKLIESGLDNSARALIRILAEIIFTTSITFSKKELNLIYKSAKNNDEADNVWYKNFRPKKINSHLSSIEKEIGLPLEVTEEISKIRSSIFKEYSSVVHSSFISTSLGAFAFDIDNSVNLGVCGRVSTTSVNSISSLNWLLFYSLMMNKLILKHYHNYKAPGDNKA